ncbi:MAG: rhomboid family intramembrane serine protease [Verrucomicrobiota bacterium]
MCCGSRQRQAIRQAVRILSATLIVLWTIEVADQVLLNEGLDRFGIRPWDFSRWPGIFLHPFLHGSYEHLLGNSIGIVLLGGAILLRGDREFVLVTLSSTIIGGLGVMVIGGIGTVHIGASGVVFGYFGYLCTIAFFEKSLSAMVHSVATIFVHWSMIFGVFPGEPGISWQCHLFGMLGGVIAAKNMKYERHGTRFA